MWLAILEAIGPELAARAVDNMRDLALLYSANPDCEALCNRLADAQEAGDRCALMKR
jgi:hypothetical protein